VMPFGW